ncbi:MAG: hypothetical protein ACYC26_10040 [Phycisphaerales bacterium]
MNPVNTLVLPKQLHFRSLCQALERQFPDGQMIHAIDLGQVDWVHASGLTGLATLVEMIQQTHTVQWLNADLQHCRAFRYFQDMDLFRVFGEFKAEDFSRRDENLAFARLTRITWETDSTAVAKNLSKIVVHHAPHIYNDFFTCLEESIRNIMDHARKPGFAVAQSTSGQGGERSYNVAIMDYGRGIRESLSENAEFAGLDDQTSLDIACKKGTSGAGYRRDPSGDPVNFGLGLYQIDTIVESTSGRFILASGNAVRIREGHEVRYESIPHWQGTAVEVSLFLSGFRVAIQPKPSGGRLRFG